MLVKRDAKGFVRSSEAGLAEGKVKEKTWFPEMRYGKY